MITTAGVVRRVRAIDLRRPLAVALAALAALLVLVITRPAPAVPVLVAAIDVAPGTPLGPEHVAVREVTDGRGLVEGSALGDLEGWSLAAPVAAGEPLLHSQLQSPGTAGDGRLLSLAIASEQAAMGSVVAGDLVDIYVTSSLDGVQSTSLVASEVVVREAVLVDRGAGSAVLELLLAVDDELAPSLLEAAHGGEIDVVRRAP